MSKERYVVDYIVELDLELKEAEGLFRYIRNEEGYWCESMNLISNGEWSEDNSGVGIALDLHNELYQRVTKEQAEKIAKQLGGSIYDN